MGPVPSRDRVALVKILLVYPDICPAMENWQGAYAHGVGYLIASVRRSGHDISLCHLVTMPEREAFLQRVQEASPDAVAFSSTSNMYPFTRTLAEWLKEDPKLGAVERLIGGIHPTLAADELLDEGFFDAIFVGEGEEAIVDYCELRSAGKSVSTVQNVWGREGGQVFRNPRRPLIDLDSLPMPAREDFDYLSLHHERKGAASVMAGRGCPFECNYCCNHALKGLVKGLGKYTRFRSVDNLLTELKQIRNTYPSIQRFAFEDDILSIYPKWFAEFCEKYPKEIGLPYSCNLHPGLATTKVADALAESGCARVNVGLESGNERIRQEVLGRKLNIDQFTAAMARINASGITLCTNNMFGAPGETMAEMLDTVKLNSQIGSTVHMVFIFYPFPRTRLYERCKEDGLLSDKTHHDYLTESVLDLPPLSRRRVHFMRDHFYKLVDTYRLFGSWGIVGKALAKGLDLLLCNTITFRLIYPHTVAVVKRLKRVIRRAGPETPPA